MASVFQRTSIEVCVELPSLFCSIRSKKPKNTTLCYARGRELGLSADVFNHIAILEASIGEESALLCSVFLYQGAEFSSGRQICIWPCSATIDL